MGIMLFPTFVYGYMFLNKQFPQTERVVSGFSYKDMLKACVSPLFLFMAFCMILTAGTELGTNQWIAALLANVSDNPILLLVWISGIMALARQFGGTLIHNLKSTVVLLTSCHPCICRLYPDGLYERSHGLCISRNFCTWHCIFLAFNARFRFREYSAERGSWDLQ